jgi:hypothetical protein
MGGRNRDREGGRQAERIDGVGETGERGGIRMGERNRDRGERETGGKDR